jgi:DNA polymerase III epsilon subunit family exonuclease
VGRVRSPDDQTADDQATIERAEIDRAAAAEARRAAPRWHEAPAGLQPVRLRRFGPLAPSGPFAVVDVETTGLDPRTDRIVEVAVVGCDGRGEIVSEWSSLVQPERDPGPTGVHGITADDLAAAPRFAEVADALGSRLVGHVVTAHNLAFDARFLHEEWARAGVERPRLPGLCTLTLSRDLHPDRADGYSLAACAAAAGIDQPDAHRALADARVTASLLGALLASVPSGRRPWPRRRLRLR